MTEASTETLRLAHKYKMLGEMLKVKERAVKALIQECGELQLRMRAIENEMYRGGCGV